LLEPYITIEYMNTDAKDQAVRMIHSLGFQWPVQGPFIFCVHHLDLYPAGNGNGGPDVSLEGRALGNDFSPRDGWRMYHGQKVPGFPSHPHRGFETITITLRGLIDHFDSAGGTGRYGFGDVQWMTAGSGLQHSEMFPLTQPEKPNTLELFQIWLNLPRNKKMVKPYYTMHWKEQIPVKKFHDENGKVTEVRIIAGELSGTPALPAAPDSWAADPSNGVRILLIRQDGGAHWSLPEAKNGSGRILYFYKGSSSRIAGVRIEEKEAAELASSAELTLENGNREGFFLLLEGMPINEPVFQYGPFVMNNEAEVQKAFDDYRKNAFGGWPWPSPEYIHPVNTKRFARYSDGSEEFPEKD